MTTRYYEIDPGVLRVTGLTSRYKGDCGQLAEVIGAASAEHYVPNGLTIFGKPDQSTEAFVYQLWCQLRVGDHLDWETEATIHQLDPQVAVIQFSGYSPINSWPNPSEKIPGIYDKLTVHYEGAATMFVMRAPGTSDDAWADALQELWTYLRELRHMVSMTAKVPEPQPLITSDAPWAYEVGPDCKVLHSPTTLASAGIVNEDRDSCSFFGTNVGVLWRLSTWEGKDETLAAFEARVQATSQRMGLPAQMVIYTYDYPFGAA